MGNNDKTQRRSGFGRVLKGWLAGSSGRAGAEAAGLSRRRMVYASGWLVLPVLALFGLSSLATAADHATSQQWLATWATAAEQARPGMGPTLEGQTIRERMRITVGGDQIRVRLSNAFGTKPLTIGSATIAIAGDDAASIKADSLRTLTFSGNTSVTIPPGAPAMSDPVSIDLPADTLVSVSLYLPKKFDSSYTVHSLSLRTAIISPPGDFTHKTVVPEGQKSTASYFVTVLSVPKTSPDQYTIVAFGDSITDGTTSEVGSEASWPANFARRLADAGLANRIAIVNEGIGGNQLRHDFAGVSAQARFMRDALSLPGVKYIVLLEGINDLGFPGAMMGGRELAPASSMPTAGDITAAYLQLIERAHLHDITIYGATLTPWKGTDLPGYYTDEKEPVRETINHWIRTSGAFDAVIDFDKLMRDPDAPHRMNPPLVSPDHLHPSAAGYTKMANSIDLSLFK